MGFFFFWWGGGVRQKVVGVDGGAVTFTERQAEASQLGPH